MTNTPTPARPALDAMAEEIERLLTWAGPQPWAVVEYGDEDSTSLAIHSSDEIRVCFMATPGSNGDEAKIATTADLIVYLKNNAPAICAAIRSLADMRAALRGRVMGDRDAPEFVARVEQKRRARMDLVDGMPPALRKLVHDYGLTVVGAFLQIGVTKPSQIKHLVEVVLNEFSPTRGSFSKQGIRTEVVPPPGGGG